MSLAGWLASLPACGRGEKPAATPLTPVRVSEVENYQGGGGERFSAHVVPFTQVDLAFKSGGYVEWILQTKGADGRLRNVQEGDWVTRGTVLARVREDEYRDSLNEAESKLTQAQAAFEQAKLDFDRASTLFATQSITKSDYDAAKARFDSAVGSVSGAKATVAHARTSLEDCSLKAPMDSWVLRRAVEVGNLAGPGTLGFSLADTHLVKVILGVPDVRLAHLKLGSAQTITTDAVPGEFRGRITAISPAADPKSRVFSVEVTIPNPQNRLKAGMIATLVLGGTALSRPVTVVPPTAVVRSGDNPAAFAVFVVESRDGKSYARARNVELGDTYGNKIAVNSGLNPGERVIVAGATLVRNGEQIQVIP